MTDGLEVWLGQEHVATLLSTGDGTMELGFTQFAREEHGLGAVTLSTALPVAIDPYRGQAVRWWVESILPEGETRTAIENRFDVTRGDAFGLLACIGADCAGAVSFLPAGRSPGENIGQVHALSAEELTTAVETLPSVPLGVDEEVRVSLGGLQAKLLLTQASDGGWGRPALGAPSTHIAKPDPRDIPGLVVAEAFTLALAAHAQIEASEFELDQIGDRWVLILQRFDREVIDGQVHRIHQEDGSAALGLNPTGRHKYQSLDDNSPTLQALAGILARHGARRREDLMQLADAVTLRTAVGDTDGHARNYGFMHTGGTVQLAPVYDAAPTSAFVATKTLALWVGGQSYLSYLKGRHLIEEITSWKVPPRFASSRVAETLERLEGAIPAAARQVPQLEERLVEHVQQRLKRLRNSL